MGLLALARQRARRHRRHSELPAQPYAVEPLESRQLLTTTVFYAGWQWAYL
jgi:hypothetical protein